MSRSGVPEQLVRFLKNHDYIIPSDKSAKIGIGTHSRVYEAREKNGEKVAAKIIDRTYVIGDDKKQKFVTRFLPREIQILRVVRHPNIIKVRNILAEKHHVIIITDFASRLDLQHYMSYRGALPEAPPRNEAQLVFRQLLEAVNYLHRLNIVHRDIKCDNVLLDARGNVKLGDFGYSRFMKPTDTSETFCGSVIYASPEILEHRRYYGIPADMWSLGIILFVILYSQLPFGEYKSLNSLVAIQKAKKIQYDPNYRISRAAQALIEGLLHPDPRRRFKYDNCNTSDWLKYTKLTQL